MRLRALALLSCVPWWFTAMPATANTELIGAPVQFHGTVVSRPCNIEPQSADQLVEMGTVIVKTLYRYGHHAGAVQHQADRLQDYGVQIRQRDLQRH